MFPHYKPPAKHTGEAFGLVYLYKQSGKCFYSDDEDLDKAIDEGFEDYSDSDVDPSSISLNHPDDSVSLSTVSPPADTIESDEEEEVTFLHIITIYMYVYKTVRHLQYYMHRWM